MLKWLVQRVPDPNLDIVTEDPLATLDFDKSKDNNSSKRLKEIYSVNRTNPLYEDQDERFFVGDDDRLHLGDGQGEKTFLRSSPPTTASSSGYGSHGTQQGRLLFNANSNSSVSSNNSNSSSNSSNAPAVMPTHQVFPTEKEEEEDSLQRETINFVTLERNPKFVRSIGMFGSRPPPLSNNKYSYNNRKLQPMSPIGEVNSLDCTNNDSIVTDSLLQMTSFQARSSELPPEQPMQQPELLNHIKRNEDMDRVIMELTQAVIKSRNVSTLTKAMTRKGINSSSGSNSSNSSLSRRDRFRSSLRMLRTHGVSAVRELWEKSGMKTNGGRKLLVDSLSEESDQGGSNGSSDVRKYRKNRALPSRKLPLSNASSISSSTSSWSDYQSPFSANGGKHSDLYTEVYNNNNNNNMNNIGGWRNRLEDDSSESGSQKKVTFSREVMDKDRAVYVIDVERLEMPGYARHTGGGNHWETYYGASGKFAAGADGIAGVTEAKTTDYRSAVFNSPYFDYRKNNSRSPLQPPDNYLEPSKDSSPPLRLRHQLYHRHKDRRRFCFYWQSILTLLIFASMLVVIVTLTIYFTNSTSSRRSS